MADQKAYSDVILQDSRNYHIENTSDEKNNFRFRTFKEIRTLSRMASRVIENEASLPVDIQNLLFLKKAAISKLSAVDVHSLSQHFTSVLMYISKKFDNIHNREILFSSHTKLENLSIIICPGELTRMSERRIESSMGIEDKHERDLQHMNEKGKDDHPDGKCIHSTYSLMSLSI